MKKVVLFGASKMGEIAYKKLKDKYEIIAFVDNDKNKWGKKLKNIEIVEPNKLLLLKDYVEIIITSAYDICIAEQLMEMNIKKFGVLKLNDDDVKFYDYSVTEKNNKEKIVLLMNNYSGSNTYALYKNVPKEILDKYDISLININDRKNSYYLDLIKSKMIVTTHYKFFYFDSSKLYVQLWHGFPIKGVSYMNKYVTKAIRERNHKEWSQSAAIASYSRTYNTIINACFGVDVDKYVITGMPRNDLLLTSDGKRNLSNMLEIDIDNKKVILYMPTFRHSVYGEINGDVNKFNVFEIDGVSFKSLDDYLEKSGLILIFKFHPLETKEVVKEIKENKLRNIFVIEDQDLIKKDLDFYEIVNSADILITDYSSIYFDYLLLDRPIIFTLLDIDEYKKNRGFLLEPLDFWMPGPKCNSLEQLKIEIIKSLEDDKYYKEQRKTIRDIVHRYKDANSSERVWTLIDNLMSKTID